ncbi:hypothetical protein Asphe3_41890 (plasmid) [Pseudarthrobacter phenanthrenivorans Sphe3]|uniref:Uncharacterized protein n=1 Tax=Pseudarthrobacter phenanthrenivorans (strain DSM 18606 / JCM 16027 / LMG 23796 / Sphe3) TaxID=930171 RepID=F0MC59_PSEPM|nr:hypothetical protein Asphe3_41890 [Pseudarthrobacter phenanthrenivorans Sphe3]
MCRQCLHKATMSATTLPARCAQQLNCPKFSGQFRLVPALLVVEVVSQTVGGIDQAGALLDASTYFGVRFGPFQGGNEVGCTKSEGAAALRSRVLFMIMFVRTLRDEPC